MKKKSNRLHLQKICGYVFFCGIDILFLCIFRSYFFAEAAFLLVLFPVISFLCVRKIAQTLFLDIAVSEESICLTEDVLWEIRLTNRMPFPALDCRILLEISNIFTGTNETITLSMPVKAKGTSSFRLPVRLEDLGKFRIESKDVFLRDFLGLFSVQIPCKALGEICVLPKGEDGDREEADGYLSGLAETEESDKKGSDFSEVSDVREYLPGDRIRDIHWKLSAKQDSLMVKQRVSVAGSEMMVLLVCSADGNETKQVFTRGYQLVSAFLEMGIAARILCWKQEAFAFEEHLCHDGETLAKSYGSLYETPFRERLEPQQKQYMKNCYPFLGSYLLVSFENGQVGTVMQDNV